MPSRTPKTATPSTKPLSDLAEELFHLHNLSSLDSISDHLDSVAEAIKMLGIVSALRAIAEHGSERERKRAVGELKRYSGGDFEDVG